MELLLGLLGTLLVMVAIVVFAIAAILTSKLIFIISLALCAWWLWRKIWEDDQKP